MNPTACALPGIALGLATVIGLPAAVAAQQLWSIEEVTVQPVTSIVMDGMAVSAAAAGAPTSETAIVEVTFDYLRLGMGHLELPLPDGSLIAAENAVFEDRGDGNLMWTGEVPGAGYESVLFTVQDGHLVGWFGEPGGPKYVVHAGPGGRGSLAVEVGPTGDWCGAATAPESELVPEAAAAGFRSASAASGSSDRRLDILVLYTTGAEQNWRRIGGPAVGVRRLGDYLNMVFRNGDIPATANLIPVRWDPKLANHPWANGGHHVDGRLSFSAWHMEFRHQIEVGRLRRHYKPDLVYFIDEGVGQLAWGDLRENLDPSVEFGRAVAGHSPWSFAHEVGHNLGGHHEPVTFGNGFEEYQSNSFKPYRFGHTDMTSCAKREGFGGLLSCPTTIMSYGVDAIRDPRTIPAVEPFYSSVRHKPNGWTIGVAGTSEVERLLHETVPVQARSGEEPWGAEQSRRVTGAHWAGRDTLRMDWSEDWGGGAVFFLAALEERSTDRYPSHSGNVMPIVGADGTQVGVEISGLRPGGGYRLAVQKAPRWVAEGEPLIRAPSSDVFHLKPRGRVSGSPAAATQVGAWVTGPDNIRLHWRDNSVVEDGYEVWYRKWSSEHRWARPDDPARASEEPVGVWRRYGGPLPAQTQYVVVAGLAADEDEQVLVAGLGSCANCLKAKRGRYSFVVVAYNDKGWNASETFDLEFMPGPHPEPTTAGKLTDCWKRPTGIDLDGYHVDACLETPDGARRRAWDYQLEADQSGLLYFFDRDNAEILVKVLDGCAINGHRWVFVAPVTTLPFKLQIREGGAPYRTQVWYYDSERRPQDRMQHSFGAQAGNPKDRTARTVSDTTAFPCTTGEIAAAKAAFAGDGSEAGSGRQSLAAPASPARLIAGSTTDCEPDGPTLALQGGYTVGMCYETYNGEVGGARDWGLDSSQSGLMYFFERNNAEVLIKVLDGCGVNGHRWVFVAPVTDLAFNLVVTSPDGQRWTHSNRLGHTADAASDTSAFPCNA